MASEESNAMNVDDLEDGEIEDDEEDEVVVEAPKVVEKVESTSKSKDEKSPSPQRKSAESKKSSGGSKKEKAGNNQDEDDFYSSIESKIASVLKEKGVEPPMPSIKKHEHSEPELKSSSSSRNQRKRRKRKERKEQKRENSSKKRTKYGDDGSLYMIGGSPDHSDSESNTSYSSYDSDEYHRSSYDDRRNKRRDKYGSRNDKERDRKDRRNRDSEKEVCLRFSEYGHCPDEDCTRVHEVRQPKKMELCKFWLMECCAKKDKCSYMHGDFPCKYYYLGLKCINKDCKFMHGKPLSDNLKQILLKHLDTAPKEILGDFPRIGRENASKMISQTHIKLCQEYNIPIPESDNKSSANKIPSLLEMKLNPPDEFSKNSDSRKESSSGRTTSRWKDAKPSTKGSNTLQKTGASEPGDTLLAEMRGILSDKQLDSMKAIGVTTVKEINNLTVSQINEIGLSLATIGEIQATAMNMFNNKTSEDSAASPAPADDKNEKEDVLGDVDMRVFPIAAPLKSPDTIMSPNQSDMETSENKANTSTMKSVMMSPPSAIDYSQYLRDSNLTNDDEDEPGLKIDYASDCETDEKKDSQSEDDQAINNTASNVMLLPPSFDTSSFLTSTSSVLSKVDISSSIQQLMEKAAPSTEKSSSSHHRDPRVRNSSAAKPTTEATPELSSPTYKEVGGTSSNNQKPEMVRRTSIYEIESPDEDVDIKIDRDKDMRVPTFLRDSENGDIDFRFPFAPMTNYIPATEIDASYGTHVFSEYKVKIVDIPKPDYSEIKRSFQKAETILDPRLKKLCGLQDQSGGGSSNLDPRKRKMNDSKDDSSSGAGPKKLQITTILQNSKHYNELSSSQKMIVNDILSELSKQLKIFHSDKSPSKIFDTSFITQNPRLSQILIGLGVFVNAEGEFEEIKDMPIAAPQVVNLPNVHQLPPTIIPSILQQPPPNLMMQPPGFLAGNLRPGILGIAPPSLPPFNYDPQNSSVNNQSNFGNEQNFNNRNQQRSGSGNNNSSNFRNNSHHRNNNNYRSNNRR